MDKSCDNAVVMVPNEHCSEDSSYGKATNIVVAKHSERLELETIECLVQRRASSRLLNRPKVRYGAYKRVAMTGGTDDKDNYVEKRAKLNAFMQHETLAKVGESDPWYHSSGCGETCVACGDDSNDSNSTSTSSLVLDELDFRGILSLKETFRLANLRRLEYLEKGQNQNKKVDNNQGIAKLLRASKVDKKCVDDKCVPGLTISKYLIEKLQRLANVGLNKIHFAQGQISKALSASPSLVFKDISNGQEAIKIIVTNECDDPPIAPTGFTYITSNRFTSNVKVPSLARGCQCKGSCKNSKTCSCAKLNGSEFPYICDSGGRLIEPRDIVFECGPGCRCGPNCGNRISQRALKYRLEVYRTGNKGWAVRTWDFVPSGAPVVEYIGVLSRSDELDSAVGNEYIFDIDCLHTINKVDGRKKRLHNVSLPSNTFVEKRDHDETMENGPEFCIDAGSFGNVARFINHGCEPNLFVQCILSSHHDIRLARVVLFASRDIHPYQELTYDYGYILGSVVGPDGQTKQLPCFCGASACRKRLY